jgi:hypothetical protein
MGGRRDTQRVLVGIYKRKRQLGRHRRRWKSNIEIDIQEVRWGGME